MPDQTPAGPVHDLPYKTREKKKKTLLKVKIQGATRSPFDFAKPLLSFSLSI